MPALSLFKRQRSSLRDNLIMVNPKTIVLIKFQKIFEGVSTLNGVRSVY